jgi:hypothetical protein
VKYNPTAAQCFRFLVAAVIGQPQALLLSRSQLSGGFSNPKSDCRYHTGTAFSDRDIDGEYN